MILSTKDLVFVLVQIMREWVLMLIAKGLKMQIPLMMTFKFGNISSLLKSIWKGSSLKGVTSKRK